MRRKGACASAFFLLHNERISLALARLTQVKVIHGQAVESLKMQGPLVLHAEKKKVWARAPLQNSDNEWLTGKSGEILATKNPQRERMKVDSAKVPRIGSRLHSLLARRPFANYAGNAVSFLLRVAGADFPMGPFTLDFPREKDTRRTAEQVGQSC